MSRHWTWRSRGQEIKEEENDNLTLRVKNNIEKEENDESEGTKNEESVEDEGLDENVKWVGQEEFVEKEVSVEKEKWKWKL